MFPTFRGNEPTTVPILYIILILHFTIYLYFCSNLECALRITYKTFRAPLQKKETAQQRLRSIISSGISTPIERCIGDLHVVVVAKNTKLDATSLYLIVPVLLSALDQPAIIPGTEAAFMVLNG